MEGETMNAPTYDDSVTNSILEVFPICQKLVMNSVNLKEPRLTKTQLYILLSLIGKPRLTMSQLAAYIASSKEQATRAVAPLVEHGYVERVHDPENRTLVYIQLTDAGRHFLQTEKEQIRRSLTNRISSLSEDDREEFQKSVSTTLRILKKLE